MNEPTIRVEGLWKSYDIHPAYTLWSGAGRAWRRLRRRAAPEPFWAVRDLSFEVAPGETIGIIGPNGAGKSTILKLLCGVTRPTRGTIDVRGRVAPLIELGAGFHPDLTGRENVLINGVMLGMSVREVREKYDAIAEFAGLGEFMDTPVKKYSSGMFARLGFAVAIHTTPDVLLVDEVLAVGDLGFQNKSLRRMAEMRAGATATVFVTHNLAHARTICNRLILLGRGAVVAQGAPDEVIARYEALMAAPETARAQFGPTPSTQVGLTHVSTGAIAVKSVTLLDEGSHATAAVTRGTDFSAIIEFEARTIIEAARWVVGVVDARGAAWIQEQSTDAGFSPRIDPGRHSLRATFRRPPLLPGPHRLNFSLYNAATGETLERWHGVREFEVVSERRESGAPVCEMEWRME